MCLPVLLVAAGSCSLGEGRRKQGGQLGDPLLLSVGLSLSGQRDSLGDVLEAESAELALRANMRSERPRDVLEHGHDCLRLGGTGKSKYEKRK